VEFVGSVRHAREPERRIVISREEFRRDPDLWRGVYGDLNALIRREERQLERARQRACQRRQRREVKC
jgi:hypothetical protein